MSNELLTVWSDSPAFSLFIWSILIITILYLGREPAHKLIRSTAQAIYAALRLWSLAIAKLETRLGLRNREILLTNGARAAEKSIQKEFGRINDIVHRDLSQYPSLHRKISESIEKIETDYQNSSQVVPLPPAWGEVVATIAGLPNTGDTAVVKILSNIKNAVEESHASMLKAYQKTATESHRLLAEMQPQWRTIEGKLDTVDEKIQGLDQCAKNIDQQIENYSDIIANKNSAIHTLGSSALTQFFISGLVILIAGLGGLINFQLIAMPMSEMVGGSSYIGAMKTSDIAALVIIFIEIAMGLFLFESLKITHLFPLISSLDDKIRKRMMYITLFILIVLASIEASLAYMRDLLALDREALQQTLINAGATGGIVEAQFRWIPSIGQMVMGFILPFALSFIAIPLESFIHSLRIIIGLLAIGFLRALRLLLRMMAGTFRQLGKITLYLYDLFIMFPIAIENLVRKQKSESNSENVSGKYDTLNIQSIPSQDELNR